ncbi:MAG: thiolase family protein [Archaeoglobaceae archaeon]|nr:thiolase family protein [Archaeoglobaceae archaeon]
MRVAVVGCGQTKFKSKHEKTHPEIVYEAVKSALEHANLDLADIQAIVYGCMDPFDGIYRPELWDSTAGSLLKPMMKISTGGTTGLTTALAAYEHVASGLFDVVMAVCVQRVGECLDAQPVLNTAIDPIYERYSGVGAITVAAFQATTYMHKYKATEEDLAWFSVKDHDNAMKNPYAHIKMKVDVEDVLKSPVICSPLKLLECCPRSDGAAAIIFASEDVAKKIRDNPAWILGEVSISDSYYLGNRPDFSYWDSLSIAARRLYRAVGIENPIKDFDVAELYSAFTIQEILELEALGFAKRGEGKNFAKEGITSIDGEIPTNPSGGVLCTNPIGASGLVRIIESSLQVMGEASNQVDNVKVALAHAWGGALQFHALAVVSSKKKLG